MALPFGTYNISVTADGYAELKDKISVSDLGLAISEEKKNYKLKKNWWEKLLFVLLFYFSK